MQPTDKPLAGKIAIVTGGASGIGRALGEELALRGCAVVLADRQGDVAEQAAQHIASSGGRATAVELDVRSYPSFRAMAQGVLQREGHIDFLFNNAGVGVGGEMDGYDRDDWDYVIDVNLRGVAYGIHAVYPSMVRRGSGHIVNTASMAGLITAPGQGSYTATKHAVVGMSKALRVEAARHGVRVSVLCPGAIRTPMLTGGVYGRIKLENATEEQLLKSWERVRPMPAGEFARRALNAVMRNDAIIVLPGWWKVFWYLERLSPALSLKLFTAAQKRLLAEIAESGMRFKPPKGDD